MERMLATPADAEIILKLYELRTEAVMREARAWMTGDFWPATAEEFFAVAGDPKHPHNAHYRQVITYWAVSYTHLDVYKRQVHRECIARRRHRDGSGCGGNKGCLDCSCIREERAQEITFDAFHDEHTAAAGFCAPGL